jgi:hypothetical protein
MKAGSSAIHLPLSLDALISKLTLFIGSQAVTDESWKQRYSSAAVT